MSRMPQKAVDTRASRLTLQDLLQRLNSPHDTAAGVAAALGLCILDTLLCIVIIARVPYTEIDWEAYMSQVDGFLSGERDYTKLRGPTGPLVYPAGFLYIFSALKYVTGGSIFPAQLIFCAFYVINAAVVMAIYVRSRLVPPWALSLLCASKRLHSIFLLRLFNDVLAMMMAYASVLLLLLLRRRPCGYVACLLAFSGAVSVKMNTLLLAPGLLFIMLRDTSVVQTAASISAAGLLQLALGWPFLSTYPREYLTKAFDLGRVFLHYWSVNLKFLPEAAFSSSQLAAALLLGHVAVLLAFALRRWARFPHADGQRAGGGRVGRHAGTAVPNADVSSPAASGAHRGSDSGGRATWRSRGALSDGQVALVLFSCNFVGIVFARTLHYQFYSWYFHTLPLLLWSTRLHTTLRLVIWLGIELCWNTFPSTPASSLLLLGCHAALLLRLWTDMPATWARAATSTADARGQWLPMDTRRGKAD